MIITYLRSSSYGSWDFCQNQYFMQYPLGIRQPSSKKMTLGSIVHKALEILARQKLAMQETQPKFHEDEMDVDFDVDTLTVQEAVDVSYTFYANKEAHIDWRPADLRQCHNWTNDTLTMSNGIWNPLKRDIVKPELFFDFEIEEPWARYAYTLPDGGTLEGQLSLKGTTDLVTRINDDTLEVVDWKTGMRKDWATGEIKTWKKLRNDPQLRMYFYAMCRLFPQIKYIIMSIVFIQDSKLDKETKNRGSYSMPYERAIDLQRTEDMIKRRFEEIKNSNRPKLNRTWKCKSFCFFGKNNWKDTNTTICEHMHNETRLYGLTGVVKKYGDIKAISNYGDGGGSSKRDDLIKED